VALAVALAVGPLGRRLVRVEAARRGVTLDVAMAWPTWGGVRLTGARLRIPAVEGVEATVEEIRVDFGLALGIRHVTAKGVVVTAKGEAGRLEEQLSAWRSGSRSAGDGAGSQRTPLDVVDAAVSWSDVDDRSPRAEIRGLDVRRGAEGISFSAKSIRATLNAASLDLEGASGAVDPKGVLTRGHAGSLTVDWGRSSTPTPTLTRTTPPSAPVAPSDPENAPEAAGPSKTADDDARVLRLPELRLVHDVALRVTSALAVHTPPAASFGMDAVTWRVTPRGGSALTLGPGPLSVERSPSGIEIAFAAGSTDGGPSLTARAKVPLAQGDTTLELRGGPVSLSALGLQDGTTGLFDVAHATVTGSARFVLSADDRDLDFDCTGSARGLSIRDQRLATDEIRGLDAQLRARGALSLPGQLRLDDFAASVGALGIEGRGVLGQERDHVAASLHIRIPTADCNAILNSLPTALLPVASGMAYGGTFGAEGQVTFDSRSLDDLELYYDVRDRCNVTAVPQVLARDTYLHPFTHRIYLPDGTLHDEETGPGTPGWTPLDQISPFMEVAVTTTEDGAFRTHHGFNRAAIRGSIIANLKARRFVRGASTITMQLAKNLFLSREKTLSRKLEEVLLTDYLEQVFSKDELLELYFNVVEFGPAVYGIGSASDYYFGRPPAELNLAESLFLSSLLPSPLRLAGVRDAGTLPDGRLAGLRSLMHAARKRELISEAELNEGLNETVVFWHGGDRPPPRTGLPARIRRELANPGAATDLDPADTDPSP
jgi:hypothetical protein